MSVTVKPELPILIAGGGPAGLTLAQMLRKRNIPYRVFERDNEIESHGNGWAVALQWTFQPLQDNVPSDLPSIETASHLHNVGLETTVSAYAGDGTRVPRPHESDRWFRADRQKLREWLTTNISLEWGKKIEKFEESKDSVKVYFEDGTTAEGSALIGAGGAHCKVRAQLVSSGNDLTESNFDAVLGHLILSKSEYEDVFKQMATSVNVIQGKDVFLFVGLHKITDDASKAYYYWMLVRPRTEESKGDPQSKWSKSKLQEAALKWSDDQIAPKFRRFITDTKEGDFSSMDSFLRTWSPPARGFSTGRVTLIGDSAHKLTPLGGVGVNHAVQDCLDLTKLLGEKSSIAEALREYDGMVTKRGIEAVEKGRGWPVLPIDQMMKRR